MSAIEQTARDLHDLLRAGGLAMTCTSTGYGLVAMRDAAVKRIYELKGRPSTKPCVTVGTLPILDAVADVGPSTRAWIEHVEPQWPLAVVARRRGAAPMLDRMDPFVAQQSRRDDTIALFFGVGPLIRRIAELAAEHGELVVGSSANLSGTGNHYTLAHVPPSLLDGVDVIIPGKPAYDGTGRLASTIVDLTTGEILRRGVEAEAIEKAWRARGSVQALAHR